MAAIPGSIVTNAAFEALSIHLKNGRLQVLDQTQLPGEEVWLDGTEYKTMCSIIYDLRVRGAPLIGIAAAFSLALSVNNRRGKCTVADFLAIRDELVATRPTAVNMKNAMDRMTRCVAAADGGSESVQVNDVEFDALLTEALAIANEDITLCDQICDHAKGANIIKDGMRIVTHCNTGSLATCGVGTALGVIKHAWNSGHKNIHVYVDETRPLLQGARLTAWELEKAGIPYTLITDSMAAILLKEKKIDLAIVGADRIALNGDFANKVGTYSLAVNCAFHKVPFYVAAPYTTVDVGILDGDQIPIEQRKAEEVRGAKGSFGTCCWSPEACQVFNPAFDVTPMGLVAGHITDIGVFDRESFDNGKVTNALNSKGIKIENGKRQKVGHSV